MWWALPEIRALNKDGPLPRFVPASHAQMVSGEHLRPSFTLTIRFIGLVGLRAGRPNRSLSVFSSFDSSLSYYTISNIRTAAYCSSLLNIIPHLFRKAIPPATPSHIAKRSELPECLHSVFHAVGHDSGSGASVARLGQPTPAFQLQFQHDNLLVSTGYAVVWKSTYSKSEDKESNLSRGDLYT